MLDALLIELDTLVVGALAARRGAIADALVNDGRDAASSLSAFDDTDRELLALRASAHYRAWLSQGITLADGAVAAIVDAAMYGPVAVVTRGTRDEAAHVLALAGLDAAIRCVVCAEDVCDGKPSPEAHRLALGRLAHLRPIAADRVLALEDAPEGVAAARLAEMRVVAVGDFEAHEAAEADAFVPSLAGHGLRSLSELAMPSGAAARRRR